MQGAVLRRAFLAASQSERLRRLAMERPVARHVAMRFVAGESLDDALTVTQRLNALGASVTLDHLGESVDDAAVARRAADVYLDALRRIDAAGYDCEVSVKPTQLGLDIAVGLCRDLLGEIAAAAGHIGQTVTIDMEGSAYTQATIDLVMALRADGHDNVGCAVQAYLHGTADDLAKLTAAGASLRLCKGAYAEPPEIAYRGKDEVDASYARLAEALLASGTYARLATHDHRLIHHCRSVVQRLRLSPSEYEFQMLYGVREPLQQKLLAVGHRLRVYVPFGNEWYPYFMRRIAERPANLTFLLRALTGRRAH